MQRLDGKTVVLTLCFLDSGRYLKRIRTVNSSMNQVLFSVDIIHFNDSVVNVN